MDGRRTRGPGRALAAALALVALLAAPDASAYERDVRLAVRQTFEVEGGSVAVSFRYWIDWVNQWKVAYVGSSQAVNRTPTTRTLCLQSTFVVAGNQFAETLDVPWEWFPKGGQPGFFSTPPLTEDGIGSIASTRPFCRTVAPGAVVRWTWSEALAAVAAMPIQPQAARAKWAQARLCVKTGDSRIIGCTNEVRVRA